jgi:hypothetical protein
VSAVTPRYDLVLFQQSRILSTLEGLVTRCQGGEMSKHGRSNFLLACTIESFLELVLVFLD